MPPKKSPYPFIRLKLDTLFHSKFDKFVKFNGIEVLDRIRIGGTDRWKLARSKDYDLELKIEEFCNREGLKPKKLNSVTVTSVS